jgi:hypothetical protein
VGIAPGPAADGILDPGAATVARVSTGVPAARVIRVAAGVSMVRLTFAQIFQFGALRKIIRSEAAATIR